MFKYLKSLFFPPKKIQFTRIVFRRAHPSVKCQSWRVPNGSKVEVMPKSGLVKVSTPKTDMINSGVYHFNMAEIFYLKTISMDANVKVKRTIDC